MLLEIDELSGLVGGLLSPILPLGVRLGGPLIPLSEFADPYLLNRPDFYVTELLILLRDYADLERFLSIEPLSDFPVPARPTFLTLLNACKFPADVFVILGDLL